MHIYVCSTCCVLQRLGHIMHAYRYIVIAPRVKTFRYVYQFILYFPNSNAMNGLTHWGRVTHICVGKLTTIGSDNGLSPGRRQAIIWNKAGILLIRNLGTNFSEILSEIYTFSFKKIHLKMSSGKWRPFCLGLNVLRQTLLFLKNVDMVCYGRCVVSGAITLTSQWHEPLLFHGTCADIRKTITKCEITTIADRSAID